MVRAKSPAEPTRSPKLAPYLVVHDAPGLMGFIERGLGGTTGFVVRGDGARPIHHAEMIVGGCVVMLADAPENRDPFPAMVHLYVDDVASSYARALAAGAKPVQPPAMAPDGDRRGGVRDAWGNEWWFTELPTPASP